MYHFEAVVNIVISILDLTGFQVVKGSFLVQQLSMLIDHFSAVLPVTALSVKWQGVTFQLKVILQLI